MSAHADKRPVYHVYPTNDLIEHDIEGFGNCECHPKIRDEGNGFVVVHNALDRRELLET